MTAFFHDLTLKIVVLGWIHAKNLQHNRLLGHIFQAKPPAIVRPRGWAVKVSQGQAWAVLFACFTVASLCQYDSWRRTRLS